MKKRIILILIIAIVVLAIVYAFLPKEDANGGNENVYVPRLVNFDETYTGDIFTYDKYLETNRTVTYCADFNGYGETLEITEETASTFPRTVQFLYAWIQAMTGGDAVAYRDFFDKNADVPTPERFSPQMICDSAIYLIKTENGVTYYRLAFALCENDGSLWRDINAGEVLSRTVAVKPSGETFVILSVTPNGSNK